MSTGTLQKNIESFLGIKTLPISEETNYRILEEGWRNSSSNPEFQKQIEARMIELNNEETNCEILERRWFAPLPPPSVDEQIRVRIFKLNKEQLPKISDYKTLMIRLENSLHDSVNKQIEARMMELISLVSKENIPEWFLVLIQNETLSSQSESVQEILKKKCEEILS